MDPRDQWPQRERSRSDEMAAVRSALNILNAHAGRRPRLTAVPRASLLKRLAERRTQEYSWAIEDKIEEARTALREAISNGACAHEEAMEALDETIEALDAAQDLLNRVPYDAKSVARAYDNIDKLIKSAGRDTERARKLWQNDAEAAKRDILDVLVLHCLREAASQAFGKTTPACRAAFNEAASQAFGRPLDRDLRAGLLLGYHRVGRLT